MLFSTRNSWDIHLLFGPHGNGTYVHYRDLVRAGATGAWAPAEIWQRVQGTRPDEGAILLSKKSAPKFGNKHRKTIHQL